MYPYTLHKPQCGPRSLLTGHFDMNPYNSTKIKDVDLQLSGNSSLGRLIVFYCLQTIKVRQLSKATNVILAALVMTFEVARMAHLFGRTSSAHLTNMSQLYRKYKGVYIYTQYEFIYRKEM